MPKFNNRMKKTSTYDNRICRYNLYRDATAIEFPTIRLNNKEYVMKKLCEVHTPSIIEKAHVASNDMENLAKLCDFDNELIMVEGEELHKWSKLMWELALKLVGASNKNATKPNKGFQPLYPQDLIDAKESLLEQEKFRKVYPFYIKRGMRGQ